MFKGSNDSPSSGAAIRKSLSTHIYQTVHCTINASVEKYVIRLLLKLQIEVLIASFRELHFQLKARVDPKKKLS
jgi:hypothetical protein